MSYCSLAIAALLLSVTPSAHAQTQAEREAMQPAPARALDLSTHVLDLARGVGGADVPVTLELKTGDTWRLVGRATTGSNGRVSAFTPVSTEALGAGFYRLTFDMARYWAGLGDAPVADGAEFFPEIAVQFRVTDPGVHVHVPVVVSPYGYSTYRGN